MRHVYIFTGVTLAWVLLFRLNNLAFSGLGPNQLIGWVFLPAGVRLVAVLLFNELAVPGLFLGALITSDVSHMAAQHVVLISAISALNPYIAVTLSRRIIRLDGLLSNMTVRQLLTLCVTAAAFNSAAHVLYFNTISQAETPLRDVATMMVGDFLGCMLMLHALSLAIKLIRRYVSTRT